MGAMSGFFSNTRLIVVKVGSSLLVDGASGALAARLAGFACAPMSRRLRRQGAKVILVSSGSIALGRNLLKLPSGALRLEESQAAAAAGQVRLAQAYADILAGEKLVAAQILLTLGDTEERDRYLNARATLNTLLDLGAVPVINENDTVATAEIRFGDNDRLGARVASMMGADKLVLLSDVDGLYTANPSRNPAATHIPEVAAITAEIEAMGGESISGLGRGGMASKLIAAKIATGAGCDVIIAKGESLNPVCRHRRWRAPYGLPRQPLTQPGAQALDRGRAEAGRRAGDRRRRGQGAGRRQEPVAGGHPPGRWPVRARRHGAGQGPPGPGNRARPDRL